jgi:hypothetical protein
MTQNKDLKSAVRARMRETGEKYTNARRAVLAGRGGTTDVLSEVSKAVQPGRITAVLSGGGATNFGLALPTIGKFLEAGQPLLHTTAGRDGVLALPNDFDFAIQLGIATEDEVVAALAADGRDEGLMAKTEPMMRQITVLEGRAVYSALAARLSERSADLAGVMWVQDFDDGGPFALGRPKLGYREELEEQMPWLRRLADETGVAIVLGHLDDDLDQRDWWPIAQHADTTFVSAHDWDEPESKDSWLVFDGTTERGIVRGSGAFANWRSGYMQRVSG